MTRCAYPHGCGEEAAPNQKYCSKEHAPCGQLSEGRRVASKSKKKKSIRKKPMLAKPLTKSK